MALRLIEIFLPEKNRKKAEELLKEHSIIDAWHEKLTEKRVLLKILLVTEETEAVLDHFEKNFSNDKDFRILLLPVEASLPRPKLPEDLLDGQKKTESEKKKETKIGRMSREELYSDIADSANLSIVYIILTALSSIVATIGILHNNNPIIIGAMVIAPLLGSNVALSLATILGDTALMRKALKSIIIGFLTSLILSIFIGFFFTVNPDIPEISSRTTGGLKDFALPLATGCAGVLAFTTGMATALTGVMVAVTLLPLLVVLGLLIGSGNWFLALGTALLLFTSVACINLAGVITFFIQGVHPKTWWETKKAKGKIRFAFIFWFLLLISLFVAIWFSNIL